MKKQRRHALAAEAPTVVAILGISRSGQSCIAGMLAKLGVAMGKSKYPANRRNPKGYYESCGITRIVQASCKTVLGVAPDPLVHWESKNTFDDRVRLLRQWALRTAATYHAGIVGAKKYKLCLLIPEMVAAWPRLKVIATARPIEDILRSMRTGSGWTSATPEQRRAGIESIWERRDADLARLNVETLRLPFVDVLRDPTAAVDRIIAFAGIIPTEEQRRRAIAHVDPRLNHHTKL
jgi:hypothetical protein